MRLGIIARNLVPGLAGIGSYIVEMTRELVPARHRPVFLTPSAREPEELVGADIPTIRKGSRSALRNALRNIERSYSIAFTPRCGSNHLCDLLARAGIGRPTEYFQYELPHWKVADLEAAVSAVLKQNTVNGIFGAKIAHDHCAWLRSVIARATGEDKSLGDAFPNHRWIRLVRKDKIAQAMSLYTAQVTQQWLVWQNDTKSNEEVPYDFPAIMACYHTVVTAELAWDVYFSEHGIEPLVVTYEDFSERPHQTVAAIAAYLAVETWYSLEGAEANLRVQRDENTASLMAQFRHTLIDIGSLEG